MSKISRIQINIKRYKNNKYCSCNVSNCLVEVIRIWCHFVMSERESVLYVNNWTSSWDYGTFVLRKLILQTCMRIHALGLDVWFLVGPFVQFHTSCVRTAKALVRLRGCAGSPEPSLVALISTIISWADSIHIRILVQWFSCLEHCINIEAVFLLSRETFIQIYVTSYRQINDELPVQINLRELVKHQVKEKEQNIFINGKKFWHFIYNYLVANFKEFD